MFHEAFSYLYRSPILILPVLASLVFFLAFIGIVTTVWRGSKQLYANTSKLPLDRDTSTQPSSSNPVALKGEKL